MALAPDVAAGTQPGYSALYWAFAHAKDIEIGMALVRQGSDPDAPAAGGSTARQAFDRLGGSRPDLVLAECQWAFRAEGGYQHFALRKACELADAGAYDWARVFIRAAFHLQVGDTPNTRDFLRQVDKYDIAGIVYLRRLAPHFAPHLAPRLSPNPNPTNSA